MTEHEHNHDHDHSHEFGLIDIIKVTPDGMYALKKDDEVLVEANNKLDFIYGIVDKLDPHTLKDPVKTIEKKAFRSKDPKDTRIVIKYIFVLE